MSDAIQIFVGTEQSLEELVRILEPPLHISFEQKIDAATGQVSYEFTDERAWVWAEEHEYTNDRDLLFEEYPYVIDIEAKRGQNWEEAVAWQNTLARQIFTVLRETEKCRLLMVWDMQRLLETFDPGKL